MKPIEFKTKWPYKIKQIAKTFITFGLVCISWIFFRANNLTDVLHIFKTMLIWLDFNTILACFYSIIETALFASVVLRKTLIIGLVLSIFVLFVIDLYKYNKVCLDQLFDKMQAPVRYSLYYLFALLCMFYFLIIGGTFGQTGQFIYFQF